MTNATGEDQDVALNPVDPSTSLKPEINSETVINAVHPQKIEFDEDSAVTKAEKYERHEAIDDDHSSSKRIKLDPSGGIEKRGQIPSPSERQRGVAPIKAESVLFNV